MDFTQPYPSARSPVIARNVVATSQPLAAAAGIKALHDGGNAVDAALATAIALTVVEPNNNGIGSDAFAIVAKGGTLTGLNASGRAPAGGAPARVEGRGAGPPLGWDAVTVPGAVSAWVALSDRFGKLPFEALFERAIHYAESGYQVSPQVGFFWRIAESRYKDFPSFTQTFLPGGTAPKVGETIRLPDHGTTLREIASTHGESFYRGRLAAIIAEDSARNGGAMTGDDLANHRCDWVEPLAQSFGDATLHEIPPSGQGIMALIGIGILNKLDLGQHALDSLESVHLQIEATRIAYAEIERHLADIDHMQVQPPALLDDAYLARRAGEITDKANPKPTAIGASPDTVYLTAADETGMMISMIQSNYRGFGSGVVVPGTGISLQNRGNGFTLETGHPNEVGGGKRPYHTIIPGFATRDGEPSMSFGVMGGHMQAQGHIQMMVRVYHNGQNPQAASDAPRWYLAEDGTVHLEDGFDATVADGLAARGHTIAWNNPSYLFGDAQLIYRLGDGYCAGSDHRKGGLAIGY